MAQLKKKKPQQKPEATVAVSMPLKKKLQSSARWQMYLLMTFAFLLYAQTLSFEYVLDDGLMITENRYTKRGVDGFWDILTHDQFSGLTGEETHSLYSGGRYRPLSQIVFALEWQFFGNNPFIGHLVNVLSFMLLGGLLFRVLLRMLPKEKNNLWYLTLPFVITALFIAHPIHTEVVANIKSLDEILAMLGGIAVLYCALHYHNTRNQLWLWAGGLFFLLGVLAKENAITFLAVVPVMLFMFKKTEIKEYVLQLTPLVIATMVYLGIRYAVFGFITNHVEATEYNHNPFMFSTVAERFATIMYTWWKYVELLLFPINLTHDYYPKQIAIINWSSLAAILPLLFFVALAIGSVIYGLQKKLLAFGILFYLITFTVVSNIVFDLGLFMNERLIFTSSLGFSIVCAAILIKYLHDKAHILSYVLFALLCIYSIKTISRSMAWKDGRSLFYTDVQTSVNSGRCNVIAGVLKVEDGKNEKDSLKQKALFAEAVPFLKRGLMLNDRNPGGWGTLGEVYIYLDQLDSSEQAYKNFLRVYPSNTNALTNLNFLAHTYAKQDDLPKAEQLYKDLIAMQPGKPEPIFNLTDIYVRKGRLDTVMLMLQNLTETYPTYLDPYNRIAEYYARYFNNIDKALNYLNRAYAINPQYSSVLENLGVAYGMKGDFKKSIAFFEKAIAVSPGKVQLYQNISKTYSIIGDTKKADYYMKLAGPQN